MPYSKLEQLWNANQCFDRLRIINLSHSNLTKIPDLSGSPYLESLILAGFNFINCLQLEQNALTNLAEYALQKIQLMPTAFCTEFDEDCDEMLRVFICYPSSEIPEWFTFQSMGSSVIARQLPQDESKERTNGWFGADAEEEEEDPFSPDPKRRKLSASFEDRTLMEGEQMQRSETELPETVCGGDIRFQALRTSDQHSGHVGSSEEQRLAGLEATVQALAAQINNTTIKEYDVSHSNLPPEDQDRSCQLAVGSNEHVLATRTILEYTTPDVNEIDELEFDRVSLLSLENDDELLIKVNNTVDHHHLPAGQENLVVHTSQKVASFQCVEKKRKLIPTIEVLELLEKFACVDINTSIEVSHEEDTSGNRCFTIFTLEDCHIIIFRTELTVSCINVYIRILYDQLKDDGMLGQFVFINPASVSVVGGVLDNAIRRDGRAHAIASGLQRATQAQLIFMPYNLGFHWILVVIDMLSMTIYYLDSLRGILRNDLKNIVQNRLLVNQFVGASKAGYLSTSKKPVTHLLLVK
ncbi:hypothetical protein LWI29_004571 [Acer saccharum]|uniref:Ubiquitin-like protease family profile domain-containing protein n=1 Tax=Acer saccharum TaxID=4024 RepID=A0AA39T155_ACESA|nr:hypothetical protein LWI29_004571 [Acer saccharum]